MITTIAIITALGATMTPVYINYLEDAKQVADEVYIRDAISLASSMLVMQDTVDGTAVDELTKYQPAYYANDGYLTTSKKGLLPYGEEAAYENSIIKVYFENEIIKAEWLELGY